MNGVTLTRVGNHQWTLSGTAEKSTGFGRTVTLSPGTYRLGSTIDASTKNTVFMQVKRPDSGWVNQGDFTISQTFDARCQIACNVASPQEITATISRVSLIKIIEGVTND